VSQQLDAALEQQLDTVGRPPPPAAAAARSPRRTTLTRILRQRSAIIGLLLLGFLVSIALLAGVLSTHDPLEPMFRIEPGAVTLSPPCIHLLGCPAEQAQHLFGLDGNARDEYSRILYGARISLTVGFVIVGGSVVVGTLIGALAGFLGGWLDNILMRLMDLLLAFPALLLTIVVITILGKGLTNAMLAVGIVSIPIYARVMRASVLSVREQDYVTAARALGDSPLSILRRRVVPNAITPLIVQATLGVGTAVLEIAALSFIGLAAVPPQPEWGAMIAAEHNQLFTSPFLVFIPGMALTLTVLGFNLLGDGLRDAFDPRLSR
jgi:ABC-type dipeptide/oligopeptide/nickel transport system permease subunit